MYYENVQSLVSYASYQKAQCSIIGGTCCMPDCDELTIPEHDGQELLGYEAICPECEIVLTEICSPELTQEYPSTPIYFNNEGQVVLDNDDDLPF